MYNKGIKGLRLWGHLAALVLLSTATHNTLAQQESPPSQQEAAVTTAIEQPAEIQREPLEGIGSTSTLSWVGCGITKKAFMAEIAKLYEKTTGVKIDISGGGATKGIRQVASGHTDLGGSCRFRIPNEDAERGAVFVPVAWDALVVIAHPDNPVEDITFEQTRRIYTGDITNWSDLGGPDQPLELYIRDGRISGVGSMIRELLFDDPDRDFTATASFPSSGPLEKGIESNPRAVGITGISSARKRNVKILRLEGKEPSYENIVNGDYLLYRPLYLAYNPDSPNVEQAKHFIQFVHGREGQEVLRKNGTVPYLEGIHLVRKKLEQGRRARSGGL